MAYRTSKPLHPTEFDPVYKTKKKARVRKKGGYKSATLDYTEKESDIPGSSAKIKRTTTSITKTKGKSGKKPSQKKKYVSKSEKGLNTTSTKDDSTSYKYTKVKKSGKIKPKDISQKKYEKKKKRIQKKYHKFRGT